MTVEYKNWIITELENWAETFNNNYPSYMEEVIKEEKIYYLIHSLIDKLLNDKCSKDDYENILFHIWQIKYES